MATSWDQVRLICSFCCHMLFMRRVTKCAGLEPMPLAAQLSQAATAAALGLQYHLLYEPL